MTRVIKYIFSDLLRTRFIIFYTAFLMISTTVMYQLDSDPGKVVLSLMNVVLMVVPLISIVFSTIHFYNSHEFIELMLAQPVRRTFIFLGEYFSVATSLGVSALAGLGIPTLIFGANSTALSLIVVAQALTLAFVSLAFLASVLTRDKAKAIGIALLFWFYFALAYDGFLLWIVYTFSDYPLEKVTLALIALNPVDLSRVIMLLQLDISALMGYTGAFYQQFFGTQSGVIFSLGVLLLWVILPLLAALRIFTRKDL